MKAGTIYYFGSCYSRSYYTYKHCFNSYYMYRRLSFTPGVRWIHEAYLPERLQLLQNTQVLHIEFPASARYIAKRAPAQ